MSMPRHAGRARLPPGERGEIGGCVVTHTNRRRHAQRPTGPEPRSRRSDAWRIAPVAPDPPAPVAGQPPDRPCAPATAGRGDRLSAGGVLYPAHPDRLATERGLDRPGRRGSGIPDTRRAGASVGIAFAPRFLWTINPFVRLKSSTSADPWRVSRRRGSAPCGGRPPTTGPFPQSHGRLLLLEAVATLTEVDDDT